MPDAHLLFHYDTSQRKQIFITPSMRNSSLELSALLLLLLLLLLAVVVVVVVFSPWAS
jgi:hypothetical protein